MKISRKTLLYVWLTLVVVCVVITTFDFPLAQSIFVYLSEKSVIYVYALIFLLGAFRGFTLVPVTYLILLGIIFLPPVPLFLIIMSGVVLSSISVYYFFKYLRIDEMLGAKYKKQIDTTTKYLSRYELPVITLWAMTPFLPSDIICYVSGTLRINIYKFVLGMVIGEGIMSGVYIFGGEWVLHYVQGTLL